MVIAEEFNKRMMTPELTDSELRSLHTEALEIYNLYMKPNAASNVSVRKELVKEIAKSMLIIVFVEFLI